jgi:hypothetical protein
MIENFQLKERLCDVDSFVGRRVHGKSFMLWCEPLKE